MRVETRRGAIELKARVDRAIPEGVLFVPFCYAEAPANFLTNPQLDPYGKIPEFKFCAARVERQKTQSRPNNGSRFPSSVSLSAAGNCLAREETDRVTPNATTSNSMRIVWPSCMSRGGKTSKR